MAFILSVFSALCLLGAGCKQQAEDVPALNKEPASSDAFAQVEADAKAAEDAKLAADAKVAEEARVAAEAKIAADAKAAEDAKLAADTKAAEDAKLAAETEAKAAEDAKLAADTKAAEDAKLAAEAEAKAAEDAKLAAGTKTESDAKVASDAKPESDAKVVTAEAKAEPVPAAPCPVGLAASLAEHFASVELAKHFGANHGRIVVQVNRAANRSDLALNRSAMLNAMQDSFAKKPGVVTTAALQGPGQVKRPKAIHLAFDTESKAIGLVPSYKVSDAPAVILNTVVDGAGADAKLTVNAIDSNSGKVFWTESKSLAAPVAATPDAKPECAVGGDCGGMGEEHADAKTGTEEHPDAVKGCPTCVPEGKASEEHSSAKSE